MNIEPLITVMEAKHLVSPFGFWKQHIPNLVTLLYPIYQMTWKAASFKRGPEQERALQLAPLGSPSPANTSVSEVSVIGKYAMPSLWQVPVAESQLQGFWIICLMKSGSWCSGRSVEMGCLIIRQRRMMWLKLTMVSLTSKASVSSPLKWGTSHCERWSGGPSSYPL